MKKFIKNQRGQGIMEYVIISSLIGICCLAVVKEFGGVIQNRIEGMKQKITHEITVTAKK